MIEAVPRNNNDVSLPVWNAGDTLKGIILAGLLVIGLVLLFNYINNYFVPNAESIRNWLITFEIGFLGELVFVLAAWMFSIKKYRISWPDFGLCKPVSEHTFWMTLLALFASLYFSIFYVQIVSLLELDFLIPELLITLPQKGSFLAVLFGFSVIIIAPFSEEVFFRSFLIQGMRSKTSVPIAIILSALLFSASHLSIGMLIPAAFSGIILGLLFLYTRSLWPPMAVHAIQNSLAYSAMYGFI